MPGPRSSNRRRVVAASLSVVAWAATMTVAAAVPAVAQGAPEAGDPDVTITQTVDQDTVVAGDAIDYHLTVENTGDVALTGVTVIDTKTPDCAGAVVDLAPTEQVTVDCSYTTVDPDDVGTRTNKAAVSTDQGALAISNQVSTTVEAPLAEVTLTKSADEAAVVAGDDIHFHVQVANTGNLPLTGIAVTDAVAPDCDAAVGALAVDASTTVDCALTTDAGDVGTVSNVASAVSDQTTSVDSNQVDVTVAAEDFALDASLTVDEADAVATETVHYHLTIENIGNRPVTGISVSDTTVPDCAGPVADLAAGAQVTVDCALVTDAGDVGTLLHDATVTSTEAPSVDTNEVSTTIVAAAPAVTISQTADQTAVFASQDVDLHLTLENTGNVTLTSVVIIDLKAPDCAGPVADLAAGDEVTIDCSYTTVLADGGTWKNTAAVDTAQTTPHPSNQIQVAVTVPTCGGEPVNISIAEGDVPTAGHDVILGTSGPDVIDALGGADFICALGGADTLTGGSGNDLLVGMNGDDTINGGSGADYILGDLDFGTGSPGNDTVVAGGGNDYIDTGGGDDTVDAGAGNDDVITKGGNDTVAGGTGDDFLRGYDGNDVLDGGDGRDEVYGDGGNDTVRGGPGVDTLNGSDGKDLVEGGTGNDLMFGKAGADTMKGGDGDDHVEGGDGADVINGDIGNDALLGGAANDTIHGNDGNDVVFGDANDDRLFGDAGVDRVNGGSGNDRLSGGTGNDGCFGDSGTDTGDASCEARRDIP